MKAMKICELCSEVATLYCDSDQAFLCWSCDERVHAANFLVARHLRRPLCSHCDAFAGASISGAGFAASLRPPICRNCSPEDSDSDADSSVCVSSNNESKLQTPKKKKKKLTMTGICSSNSPIRFSGEVSSEKMTGNDQNRPAKVFKLWCRRFGLNGNSAKTVASLASHALRLCVRNTARVVLPLKLALAASFWYGLCCFFGGKISAREIRVVRMVEEISGVSARLILAVGLKINREFRAEKYRRSDLEEGWAETESLE